ncbi:hypothetical protein LSH36_361g02000 [Paralvinella palmiformis]|uniref:SAM domain-containing protein n=1 Tax=Paralvinella palmiformis TaxID=53620 RepID=A0AAD9N267_9ANNE|nr:hypothetical protein LSH36_361g02000 [Paralvinella palmiformis]
MQHSRRSSSSTKQRSYKYSTNSFKWSDKEYTPGQILDNFQPHFPILIKTTAGFLGQDESVDDISTDEMFWLHDVMTLQRIVVVNKSNVYFSVPTSCTTQVLPLKGSDIKDEKPIKLSALINENISRTFMFVDDDKHYIYEGNTPGGYTRLGQLRIVDTYQERYLLTNIVHSGYVYIEAILIPVYLPINLVVAVDMRTGDQQQFHHTMLALYNEAKLISKPVEFPKHAVECNDITMFKHQPDGAHYDIIMPYKRMTRGRGRTQNVYSRKLPVSIKKAKTPLGDSIAWRQNVRNQADAETKMVTDRLRKRLVELQQVLATGAIRRASSEKLGVRSEEDETKDEYTALIPPDVTRAGVENRSYANLPLNVINLESSSSSRASPVVAESRINKLEDVPEDLSRLNLDDVGRCLELLGLDEYKETFQKELIDGQLLMDLDSDTLQAELDLSKFKALKLCKFIKGWRPV